MFSGLKKKLKSFLRSEKPEEKPDEKSEKEKKKIEKFSKEKLKKKNKPKELHTDKQLKKEARNLKEVPQKFNVAEEKYEPDIEAIKKELSQEKNIEKELKVKEETKEKKGFFKKFVSKLNTTTLEAKNVDELFEPLEIILLENNVNLNVVDKIKSDFSRNLIGMEIKKDKIQKTIQESLKNSISDVLIEPPDILELIKEKSKIGEIFTIVFFGINGSGKTTSLAKLTHKLQQHGISCVLAAADTFRAASIEQLKQHGEKLKTKVIAHDYGSDPAAVAFDAKVYAKKHKHQVVLIDTAGRMYTRSNLLKEMEKIIRISKPDLKIFVAESITGNDATEQAKTFNEAIGIDGIILTKADVDEKGGVALSVSYITKKPIFYLGTGQKYHNLQEFKKEDILKNLGLD